MALTPVSEAEIWDYINRGWEKMTPPECHFWEMIRIDPEKWHCPPWSESCGGFWAVAVIGKRVVWYNEIESGFNCSEYAAYGSFKDYWCNQDGLEDVVRNIKTNLDLGLHGLWRAGPPQGVRS